MGLILGLYLTLLFLLNLSFVQEKSSLWASKELSALLDCPVEIGRMNLGWLNRIVLDDVEIKDQNNESLLSIARLTAKFEILPLFQGKISIRTVQLFSFNINMSKETPDSPPNFKFLVDALKSDEPSSDSSIDLRINSILIRRGNLSYHVHSEKETPEQFNANHVHLENILANISLKALTTDSINAHIKRLSLKEQSGFELNKLGLKVTGNHQGMRIEDFEFVLPESKLELKTIELEYDSLAALAHFGDEVKFALETEPSHITLKDFQAFAPVLRNFKEKLHLSLVGQGSLNDFELPLIKIYAAPHFSFEGNASVQDLLIPNEAHLYINLPLVSADQEGLFFIARNFNPKMEEPSKFIQNLEFATFKGTLSGYIDDLVAYGECNSGIGSFDIDMKLSRNLTKDLFSYSGGIKTTSFNLGKLVNNKDLEAVTLNFEVEGVQNHNLPYPEVVMQGVIDSISYKKYTYQNIAIDGEFKEGGFDGSISLDDTNGNVSLLGSFNIAQPIPSFNFEASFNGIRPQQLNISKKEKESEWSMDIKANFTGGSIDQMNGEVSIENLRLVTPEKIYRMNYFKASSIYTQDFNQLIIDSEFIKGKIDGKYSYRSLPRSFQKLLYLYLPALSSFDPDKGQDLSNQFRFKFDLYNTDILHDFFDVPLKIYTRSSLEGTWNDNTGKYSISCYFPQFQYKTDYIESGVFLFNNYADEIQSTLRFNHHRKSSATTLALNLSAKENEVYTKLDWGNSGDYTYSGSIIGKTHLTKEEENESLKSLIEIEETQVILNDSIWKVHPSTIEISNKEISVDNFLFSHLDQYLHINGKVSSLPEDTLQIDLNSMNIGYIFDMANIKETVNFNGNATGKAIATHLFDKPVLETRLHIQDFSFNEVRLGNMDISGNWDIEEEGIYLEADIQEEEIARTKINGYIYPLAPKSGLHLTFDANNINVGFIEHYTESIMAINGRASGKFNFYGPFKALNMEASPYIEGDLNIYVLNTTFHVKDTLKMTTNGIQFNKIAVTDVEGNPGEANGNLYYQHFRDLSYDFNIMSNNMLVMNTHESKDMPFYGRIYASGISRISGNSEDGVNINVEMSTNRNTNFTYSLGTVASATSREFIQFNDVTPQRIPTDSLNIFSHKEYREEDMETTADI
ncbi:MAG: translocation/assembly module TamB, partial [Bacteroidales bacterium]|nr:translocation/assembly module TamB [Bacteroidales bacterium]